MTHSGGKPHAVGDRGQRYEVSVYDDELQARRVVGWANDGLAAHKLGETLCKRPGWSMWLVKDRHEQQTDIVRSGVHKP